MLRIRATADSSTRVKELICNLKFWQERNVYNISKIRKDRLSVYFDAGSCGLIKVLKDENFKLQIAKVIYRKIEEVHNQEAFDNKFRIGAVCSEEIVKFISDLTLYKYQNNLSDQELLLVFPRYTQKRRRVYFYTTSQNFLSFIQNHGYSVHFKSQIWFKI